MMPSLDHCVSNTSEMTTLSNTLEVFDTYKHREEKDSDEESFHLPLDDDELDTKAPEPLRNGTGNETEEDILNKFDNTPVTEHIEDPHLEETLLNEDDDEKKEAKDDADSTLKENLNEIIENGLSDEKDEDKPVNGISESEEEEPVAEKLLVSEEEKPKGDEPESVEKCKADDTTIETINIDSDETIENIDVPKVAVEEDTSSTVKEVAIDTQCSTQEEAASNLEEAASKAEEAASKVEKAASKAEEAVSKAEEAASKVEEAASKVDEPLPEEPESNITVDSKEPNDKDEQKELDLSDDVQMEDLQLTEDKPEEKDDFSKHNEDSEDLFDISVIRDAEEDNAESAYNEAHPEETEEYEDRSDEKMEEDCVTEKVNHDEEDDDEIDIDKQEEHLKNDDVDIEEDNLKLECDATKDSVSGDEDSEGNKTDLVQVRDEPKDSEPVKSVAKSAEECRLDEVTGSLVDTDGREINYEELALDGDKTSEDSPRTSLKRPLVADTVSIAKKSRIEQPVNVENKEVEKPKDKLPLKTLLSLPDFMRTRKHNKRLTMHDLEEFCIQKICEVIVHKSELGDVHHQLKLQEQLIETMRKEIQQLTKQARDLEIVNKKLMNDLKQQTTTQKPLNPLKITRSVGLQVKFTPTFEANLKRRQPNLTLANAKGPVQAPSRPPRVVPNAVALTTNKTMVSPQKQQQQQQQQPKPSTPLLSQALQNRRNTNDNLNKMTSPTIRTKPVEVKNGPPSASVIDLTDEDDKKDKNKNSPKMVTSKNITVPLRTTPIRVNATPQGLRLATSQGKVSPITSVVTSSTPQVMYVVQSSPQNVLSPLGSKAVVVNFQSANGVITSTLNGSAVSVIPKQGNTIQLKTVGPAKALQNNKLIKVANKHPAPLPPPPIVRAISEKPLKPIPPKPHLTIRKTETGIILQWKMPYELEMYEVIASYQLYAYQETSALPSTDMWRKVGDVKALALPMACTLTQFADKNKYYFAVRPVDIHKRIGMFSEPEEISL